MKKGRKMAMFISLFILIAFPLIFLILSLKTGQWKYITYSLAPILAAGLTGVLLAVRKPKE
jgi:hypothetical protein